MNFLGLVLLIGLIVAVELTVFSLARTTQDKVRPFKDDDNLGVINSTIHAIHKSKHAGRRSKFTKKLGELGKTCLGNFAFKHKPPIYPSNQNTRAICQWSKQTQVVQFATLFDVVRGMPLYSAYSLSKEELSKIGTEPEPKNPQWTQTQGLLNQGSKKLYKELSIPYPVDRGHLAPFKILSHSKASGLASYSYTNAVPQYWQFNRIFWRTYEGRIRKFARNECKEEDARLYLMTGTSEAHLLGRGGMAKKQEMKTSSINPKIQSHISVPNSMWTVGCCANLKTGEILATFAVIGNNVPDTEKIFMQNLSIAELEKIIRLGANDYGFELYPGCPGCYAIEKQRFF